LGDIVCPIIKVEIYPENLIPPNRNLFLKRRLGERNSCVVDKHVKASERCVRAIYNPIHVFARSHIHRGADDSASHFNDPGAEGVEIALLVMICNEDVRALQSFAEASTTSMP
jgi:hypothetical protein